jgi:hypothetical protein
MQHPNIAEREDRKARIKAHICEIEALKHDPDSAQKDKSGHGTHVALLLMEIAPQADIYVARVFQDGNGVTADYIAQAIELAVNEWKVDIISMSFGFPNWIENVDKALKLAHSNDVLLFAAAANDGGNTLISKAWPARDPKVFCVHATDEFGSNWHKNPPRNSKVDNWATLGVNVLSGWTEDKMQAMTGTSIATPIAAGTAALFIDFARIPLVMGMDYEHLGHVRSFPGMRSLFKASSKKMTDHNYRYIKPWDLFMSRGYDFHGVCSAMEFKLEKFFGHYIQLEA